MPVNGGSTGFTSPEPPEPYPRDGSSRHGRIAVEHEPANKPRLAVVSYLAHDLMTPRGPRTRAVIEALCADWRIELRCSSARHASPSHRAATRTARNMIARARKRVMLDNQELWSHANLGAWEPDVAGALLIGWPISPLVYASARLSARGIPYVLDVGDPWMLTHPAPDLQRPVASRAIRAERRLWASASGAVVTTTAQAKKLLTLYPALPILVRPNGYEVVRSIPLGEDSEDRHPRARETLNLVHFGTLSGARLDPTVPLTRLVNSGRWREVRFAQYGSDWNRALESAPGVLVTRHNPVPWEEAVAAARNYDAAIAFGYPDSDQMPSKAVQYLSLPIPRVAIVSGAADDPMARYLADKPGWLCSAIDDPRLAETLGDHLSRSWYAEQLAPPPSEAWPSVANEIAAFVNRVLAPAAVRSEPLWRPIRAESRW